MIDEEEEDSYIEAHRIIITYNFDADGREYVSVQAEEGMSSILLAGILDTAKNRIQNPELYE
jgi:hypothetical protein